jgi:predicted ArsR family transcriptional regulator
MLLRLAGTGRLTAADAVEAGREQGELDGLDGLGQDPTEAASCLEALVARLDALGFDPAVVQEGSRATVAFTHCPFRDLAETEPDLVCGLHRGLVEGFVSVASVLAGEDGTEVASFHPLLDRTPCQMSLALAGR